MTPFLNAGKNSPPVAPAGVGRWKGAGIIRDCCGVLKGVAARWHFEAAPRHRRDKVPLWFQWA